MERWIPPKTAKNLLFRVKSLTINICFGVSPFLDLCVNVSYMAIFDHRGQRSEIGERRLEDNSAFRISPNHLADNVFTVVIYKNSVKFHDI